MKYYSSKWEHDFTSDASSSADSSSVNKKKGGAKKGFKDTAGKTSEHYDATKNRLILMRKNNVRTIEIWSRQLREAVKRKEIEAIATANDTAKLERDKAVATQKEAAAAAAEEPSTLPLLSQEMDFMDNALSCFSSDQVGEVEAV